MTVYRSRAYRRSRLRRAVTIATAVTLTVWAGILLAYAIALSAV